MSENTYTPEQRTAIGSDDPRILVSAGAGSGKTFVMTERITRLIEEKKATADSLLVVTFTNAAAAQMKRKIRSALMKKAALDPTGYLRSQVPLLEFSQISTVHAFCLSVIREYYQFAGVDPAFGVLPEDQADIMLSEAVDEAFRAMYQDDRGSFTSLAESYSGRDEEDLKSVVKKACTFLSARTDPSSWISRSLKALESSVSDGYGSSLALPYLRQSLSAVLEEAGALFRRAHKISLGCSSAKRSELLDGYASDALILAGSVRGSSFSKMLSDLGSYKAARYQTQKGGGHDDILIDKMRELAKKKVDSVTSALGFGYESYLEFTEKTLVPAKALAECIARTLSVYEARKRAACRLDYSDLEHLCLKVLEDASALEAVKSRYTHIFVDEYQDTNDIQEAIIEKISEGKKLFTVGDIKQSIYSFRDAEPALFSERRKRYEEDGEGTLVQLPDNFRSAPALIDAVNGLFTSVMTEENGGVDFRGKNEAMKASSGISCAAVPKVTTVISDEDGDGEASTDKNREEARYVASLVSELLQGTTVDEKTGEQRRKRPSDITVLLRRTKDTMPLIASELRKAGIPVDTGTESGFYDMAEIELMLNILRITDNYKNDIALASVMRSIVYGFDPDDLVRIRLWGRENGIREFHSCARSYDRDDSTGEKLRYMWSQIDSFTEWEQRMPVYSLVETICEKTDLFVLAGSLPDGASRQNNLRVLRDLAESFESAQVRGLSAFIRFADSAASAGRFKTRSSKTDQDAVKIMSVHASKGLEFDTVILADCARRYNKKETEAAVILDKHAGICMDLNDGGAHTKIETMEHRGAVYGVSRRTISEEMRILYVALTRAKRELYMTGSLTAKQYEKLLVAVNGPGRSGLGDSFLEVIYKGLMGSPFAEFETVSSPVPAPGPAEAPPAAQGSAAAVPPELYREISGIMEYVYPHASDLVIPTKLSVSSLKDPGEELEMGRDLVRLSDPPSFAGQSGASGAAIGTMTHRILEKIDLKKAGEDPSSAIEETIMSLISSGALPEDAPELVDRDSLIRFFSSETGRKLTSADSVKRECEFIMKMKASQIRSAWKDSGSTVMIQGIIDCVFEKDGRVYLLDYKTDRNLTPKRRALLDEEYSRQVGAYMRAYSLLNGRDVDEAYICYLSNGSFVRVTGFKGE